MQVENGSHDEKCLHVDGRVIRIEHSSKCKSDGDELEAQQDMRNASYYVS